MIFSFLFFIFLIPGDANAATLYFSPSSGSHSIGGSFSVSVFVSSSDQAMNAASGIISFPPEKLQVLSISKIGSIMSLWVQEPSFSNAAGTINLEGVVLNPGFTGSSGKVITITFKVKSAGPTPLNFTSGSVLANDGNGTNILTSLGSAEFTLDVSGTTNEEADQATTPSDRTGASLAPQVTSQTHPDPTAWYANSSPQFSWSLPNDATAVSFAVTKNPGSNPGTLSDGIVSTKKYDAMDNGIWYFHLRLKNKNGWGDISHFKFQIDAERPALTIEIEDPSDLTEPTRRFLTKATDAPSGIDGYKIGIDSADLTPWKDEKGTHIYETPALSPGDHRVTIKAYDKAGNLDTETKQFSIKALDAPVFTDYPQELVADEVLKLKGRSYPNSTVVVFLKTEDENIIEERITTDDTGAFSLIWPSRMKRGLYEFWGQTIDGRGARSFDSEHFNITVGTKVFLQIGSLVISYLTTIITLLILIFALLLMVWYGWQRFRAFRFNIKKDVNHAEKVLHKTFDLLKEDIREQLKLLERAKTRRRLTQEEELILKRLKQHLDEAEQYVNKEIHDIDDLLGL